MLRIATLLTCHNRRDKTLSCLKALYTQVLDQPVQLSVYLVDDGSTDNTQELVRQAFPEVHILPGNGSLFWNRGMHLAFEAAMKQGYDYYLWLNDDTNLSSNALQSLLEASNRRIESDYKHSIIVGSICDPQTGEFTYGGQVRANRWHQLRCKNLLPNGSLQECHTMNGNCVLIPQDVAQIVGNLDPNFNHRYGDIDYGFRARKLGCSIWITSNYVGTCSGNTLPPLHERLKWKNLLQSPTGLPFNEHRRFAKKHTGMLWPLYAILPYLGLYLRLYLRLPDPAIMTSKNT